MSIEDKIDEYLTEANLNNKAHLSNWARKFGAEEGYAGKMRNVGKSEYIFYDEKKAKQFMKELADTKWKMKYTVKYVVALEK